MILDNEDRERLSEEICFPTWTSTGVRVAEKREKEGGPDWKALHMRIFQQFGLDWPVNWAQAKAKRHIRFACLREREA